jgi:hypothetical protein
LTIAQAGVFLRDVIRALLAMAGYARRLPLGRATVRIGWINAYALHGTFLAVAD